MESWKRSPQHKKNGIACAIYDIIDSTEVEELEDLSIEQIARILDVSESYISRAFKDFFTHMPTPQKFIIRHKLKLAKKMLIKYPKLSMNEIAEKLAYCSGNYFIKVFKKYYKITPAQFRKQEILQRKRTYKLVRLSRKLERAINQTIFEATNGKFTDAVMVHGGLDDKHQRCNFFY